MIMKWYEATSMHKRKISQQVKKENERFIKEFISRNVKCVGENDCTYYKTLMQQNRQLKEALKFYANEENYKDIEDTSNLTIQIGGKILHDEGKIAQEALRQIES